MPRKTIAGLEAIIEEQKAIIEGLKARLDQKPAPAKETDTSMASVRREIEVAQVVSQHVGRRRLRKIRKAIHPRIVESMPRCWNFLRTA